ncbi:MAG: response regulator [Salinivirgaceae bacterium]|nr:response regulator [Salinivirgaceae bacterium]
MKKVLIIEDNEDNLYMLQFILEKNSYEVISARTGTLGYEMALNEKLDFILMDIQLPDINGMDVTRKIRASKIGNSIPIIAVTSYAMTGDRERALEAGCTGYIEKPINPETVMDEIHAIVN